MIEQVLIIAVWIFVVALLMPFNLKATIGLDDEPAYTVRSVAYLIAIVASFIAGIAI